MTYERDGQTYDTIVNTVTGSDGYPMMGVTAYVRKASFTEMFQYGFYEVKFNIELVFKSLAMLFQGKLTADDMAGRSVWRRLSMKIMRRLWIMAFHRPYLQ